MGRLPERTPLDSFDQIQLRPQTRAALAAMNITVPTPIQREALPVMLEGRDVIGQARTGSGKTLAFALPMVERLDERQRDVQALVLVPTRELATQVAGVIRAASAGRDIRTLVIVGGASANVQQTALRHGVHVVAGTPGRVLDHINQGALRLDKLRLLVLDEADEMLDRGFAPDVERIIARCSAERQTALFSATVPEWVDGMAKRHLRTPVAVRVDTQSGPVEHVEHAIYDVPTGGKLGALQTLLDARGTGTTLVFGRTKHGVKRLTKQLTEAGYPVAALQGNLSQNARDRVMESFRSGETEILIATNVAARGLDIDHVAEVINYELPETADLLTHRVGRTGRMGRAGRAITLLTPEDEADWRKLARQLRRHPTRTRWNPAQHPSAGHVRRIPDPSAASAIPARTPTAAGSYGSPARQGAGTRARVGPSNPRGGRDGHVSGAAVRRGPVTSRATPVSAPRPGSAQPSAPRGPWMGGMGTPATAIPAQAEQSETRPAGSGPRRSRRPRGR